MTKLSIKSLKKIINEAPLETQLTQIGGLTVAALLKAIQENFDCFAGMQFTCDNGEVTAMTSSNGTSYSIGPEITIADLTSNGGSNSSYWVDRSTG